ncbi:hypothetical protein [Angustibacter aerolatus]
MGLRDLLGRRRPDETTTGVRSAAKKIAAKTIGAPGRTRHQELHTGPINISRDSVEGSSEGNLRHRVEEDPNDAEAFAQLAEIVRRRAAEGHEDEARPRAAADAEWALAEELAHSSQAWYPLIRLAKLSLDDDPDAALRRLATAAEREPTGRALAEGISMLRGEGKADLALSLGVGHWRPREHLAEAGREVVQAAVAAGRFGDARRQLDVLLEFHDEQEVTDLTQHLDEVAPRRP